jgi:hypothetical protein
MDRAESMIRGYYISCLCSAVSIVCNDMAHSGETCAHRPIVGLREDERSGGGKLELGAVSVLSVAGSARC